MALLATRALDVSIAGQAVCRRLEIAIEPGASWAILGRNGVGKTTLLKALAGLHPPDAGEVRLGGESIAQVPQRRLARAVGVLFQDSGATFPSTVLETVLIGRHPYLEGWSWEGERDFAIAAAALGAVDLSGFEARDVGTLSGGERQRLAVATLLAQDPSLYLLDEPTNHLDLHHQIHILQTLRGPGVPCKTTVMVLHDVNLAARFCDHALLLSGAGTSLHGPIAEVLNAANLERVYGHPIRAVETGEGVVYLPR